MAPRPLHELPTPRADAGRRFLACLGESGPVARALINARILTMESPGHQAEAILWTGDRITAIGTTADIRVEAKRCGAQVDDLEGRVVLPGFVDAHTHFLHVGVKATRPDLSEAPDRHAALGLLAAWLQTHPEGTIIGEGWDEETWPERRAPVRGELDDLDASRPIVLRRVCGHIAVANTPALRLVRQRWDDERVDMETGLLTEEPSLYLNEVLEESEASLDAAVPAACAAAHRAGVTTVGEYCQEPYLKAFRRAAAAGTLTVRTATSIYVQQLQDEIQRGFRTGRLHPGPDGPSVWLQDSGLKVFLDGSLGGHTAYLREPYSDKGTRGRPNWTPKEVRAFFEAAHEAGIQIHAHAIGDAAIDLGLDAFAPLHAADPEGFAALRHRFEHYEIAHDEQVKQTARLGVVASSQPNFVGEWSAPGGMYDHRLGPRLGLNNRFRTFKEHGMIVAFGSDGMPFGPLYGIHCAVHHPEPDQRLLPAEAIWHYTNQAAWSLHMEDVGVLREGAFADIVILDMAELDDRPDAWPIQETISGGVTRFLAA